MICTPVFSDLNLYLDFFDLRRTLSVTFVMSGVLALKAASDIAHRPRYTNLQRLMTIHILQESLIHHPILSSRSSCLPYVRAVVNITSTAYSGENNLLNLNIPRS